VKRVLASYRWRRRLVGLTVTAAVVAGVVAIGVRWSNTAPHEAVAPKGALKIDYAPPKPVRLKLRDKAAALAVASRFIDTAVARKDVDRAWGLVTPELRAGYTRKQWDTEDLPGIPPFPVASARWALQFSDAKGIGFTMALFGWYGKTPPLARRQLAAGSDHGIAGRRQRCRGCRGFDRAGHASSHGHLGQGKREPNLAPPPGRPAQPDRARPGRNRRCELASRPPRQGAIRSLI
jgi:hypothetical protein